MVTGKKNSGSNGKTEVKYKFFQNIKSACSRTISGLLQCKQVSRGNMMAKLLCV